MDSSSFPVPAGRVRPLTQRDWSVLGGLALMLLFGVLEPGAVRAQSPAEPQVVPADFVHNRIYVTAVTSEGDSLRLLTDTGGGRVFVLTEPTVERLGLPVVDTVSRGRRSIRVTQVPSFRANGSVPSTSAKQAWIVPSRRARLVNYDDGRLGMNWFAGRVWTFDYGAERLLLHGSTEHHSFPPEHTVDLAFRTDSTGARVNHHARIEATVADSTYSFLFDTGATTVLTDSAQSTLGGPRRRGVGFVTASLLEHWKAQHPDWRVVNGASIAGGGMPLIRVPEVTVAGHTVGPVWFEQRPDRAFQGSLSMDRPVVGALGGSLFRYFRITVDYPGARAHFRRLD